MNAPDNLMKPAEVGALLGVSAKTVARWAETGKLPAQRTLGGHRRFLRSDVLTALREAQGEAG